MDEVLLHQGDEGQHVARKCTPPAHPVEAPERFGVDLGEDLAHHQPFLEAVEEKALSVGRVIAQESRAEAVEGRDPGLAVFVVQALVDSPGDLGGGAGREGEHKDLAASRRAFAYGLLVQVDQRVRLSGTGSGEHPQWSVDFVDVEWQRVPLEWRGRPDYAGARVLKSAVLVKGRQAKRPSATRNTSSNSGQRFKPGLCVVNQRYGLASTQPTPSAARHATSGRSSHTIQAAATRRQRSDAWR